MPRTCLLVLIVVLTLAACGPPRQPEAIAEPVDLAEASPASASPEPAPTPVSYPAPTSIPPVVRDPSQNKLPLPARASAAPCPYPPPAPEPGGPPPACEITLPQVGPLLRDVWSQGAAGSAATRYLIYSTVEVMPGNQMTSTIWQVDLREMTQSELLSFETPYPMPLRGQLSPDGQWIAYATSAGTPTLHVVRRDGSDDRVVGEAADPSCSRSFSWSPDSRRLAFQQWWDENDQRALDLLIFTVDGTAPPTRIARQGLAELVGWRDPEHVLTLIVNDAPLSLGAATATPVLSPELELVALTVTGDRTPVVSIPGRQVVGCTALAPDRRRMVVVAVSDEFSPATTYLVDLQRGDLRSLDVSAGPAFWAADSTSLLLQSWRGDQPTQLVSVDPTVSKTPMTVAPPQWPHTSTSVVSTSPDGAYLVLYEGSPSGSRVWVYVVAEDRWQILVKGSHDSRYMHELQVFGWLPDR